MEEAQINHIRKNLVQLTRNTSCNTSLINVLVSKNILGVDDEQALNSVSTPTEKASTLYRILYTRINSYVALKVALRGTNQSGALEILEQLGKSGKKQSLPHPKNQETTQSGSAPKGGQAHLKQGPSPPRLPGLRPPLYTPCPHRLSSLRPALYTHSPLRLPRPPATNINPLLQQGTRAQNTRGLHTPGTRKKKTRRAKKLYHAGRL